MGRIEDRKKRKEIRKAERLKKRNLNKQFKALRREKVNAVKTAVTNAEIEIDLENKPVFVGVFNQGWPILRPAMELAIVMRKTGDLTDKILATAVDLGDRISTGKASEAEETEFVGIMSEVWVYLQSGLLLIQALTGEKADAVIDEILEVGEWILAEDRN